MFMWKLWASFEGITKIISTAIQKPLGVAMGTVEMGAVASIIIGMIQALSGFAGFVGKMIRGKVVASDLAPDLRSVLWAILFGISAGLIGTVWSIYTFTLGADMGIRTLLISFSIVPAAIIGRMIWNDPLGVPQWLGIGIFMIAVWAMLDFPSLAALVNLPVWVWAVFVVTAGQVLNETLSRSASLKLDVWVNNFWVGISTILSCLLGLIALWIFGENEMRTLHITDVFLYGSVALGIMVVPMISFKLLAYKAGGEIGLKKIIMYGVYLIGSAFVGWIFYDEPWTAGKTTGLLLFPLAVGLTDYTTYMGLKKSFFAKKAPALL